MIRFLADYSSWYGPVRVFDSITFRAVLGMGLAFSFVLLSGGRFVRWLRGLRVTEDVSKPDSETLDRLHAPKGGTPTMGGLMVVVAILIVGVLTVDPTAGALLRGQDLKDVQTMASTLVASSQLAPAGPAARIWEGLGESERAAVRLTALEPDDEMHRAACADALNTVLVRRDLYDAEVFAGVALPAATRMMAELGADRLLERNLQLLNRDLLEGAFPGAFQPRRLLNPVVLMGFAVLLAFGLLGFVDDLIKLRGRQGLTKKQKLAAQIVFACVAAWGLSLTPDPRVTTRLLVPFTKWAEVHPDLGVLYFAFFAFVIVACSNAVNLTDGLDGLASGSTIMVCMTYAVLAYVVGNAVMCAYFRIPHVPGSGELTVLCATMLGAVMGFLWFNAHPAQVFMGDTGSLALGAVVAYVALVIKHELVLVIAGGVFVLEAASVLLQMASFKTTGRRIFKCAPFHHHLEFAGWHENHVVVRLWIVGAILSGAALATLKMH